MTQRKLGGVGAKRMQPALDYAQENGFEIGFTKKQHIQFRGYGGTVIGSGTPRNEQDVQRTTSQMRRLVSQSKEAKGSGTE